MRFAYRSKDTLLHNKSDNTGRSVDENTCVSYTPNKQPEHYIIAVFEFSSFHTARSASSPVPTLLFLSSAPLPPILHYD